MNGSDEGQLAVQSGWGARANPLLAHQARRLRLEPESGNVGDGCLIARTVPVPRQSWKLPIYQQRELLLMSHDTH